MILPVVAYGAAILRERTQIIGPDTPGLTMLIQNMRHTMHYANGVGLAAPQVNKPWRLFIIHSETEAISEVFINAVITAYSTAISVDTEGCLSIPGIWEEVKRSTTITIRYQNERFENITRTFEGNVARMIQHEYDHIEGKLYIDYLPPLRKTLIRSKLQAISKGKQRPHYPMIYP